MCTTECSSNGSQGPWWRRRRSFRFGPASAQLPCEYARSTSSSRDPPYGLVPERSGVGPPEHLLIISATQRPQKQITKSLTGAPYVRRQRIGGRQPFDPTDKMIDLAPPPPTANSDAISRYFLG